LFMFTVYCEKTGVALASNAAKSKTRCFMNFLEC